MKKFFTGISFCFLLSFPCYSQVGIGTTTPIATLDIQSKTSIATDKALEINNSSGTEVFTVFNNGNLEFKGALMPNNDPGISGQFLISKGGNTPPVWSNLPIPAGTRQIREVFEITSGASATNVPANTWAKIIFTTTYLPSDPAIGTWDAATNEFTINQAGLYIIASGTSMFTNTNIAHDTGLIRIHTGSSIFEYGGETTECNTCTPIVYWQHCNGENAVLLNAGDKIWLESQAGASWTRDNAFLHIKYVP